MAGIVLAGGRSRRFGSDKLTATIDGRPLLHHPILALAACCATVIVAAAHDGPAPTLPGDLTVPVLIVRDAVGDAGPLAGLVAGLEAAREEIALVVGGDQPALRPDLLRLLLAALGDAAAAVLADEGQPRALPAALRRGPALAAARTALGGERRSLLGVVLGLEPIVLPETAWRGADLDGAWQRDIDRPEDLRD